LGPGLAGVTVRMEQPDPLVADFNARIAALPAGAPVCVGLSGGLDSVVLLHLFAEHAEASGRKVSALHVHHGLSPNADNWVKFCERLCANQGVPLVVERVRVNPDATGGVEAAARMARYAAFAARPETYIALAHHLDDQAETVLFQLLRGTGLKGIAAMPELRPLVGGKFVFRPLLQQPRAAMRAFAQSRGLRWIEDESNALTLYDRNFLRLQVAPMLDERFPGWQESLARFARHAGAAGELLDALALADGVPVRPGVPLPLREDLSAERRSNALRAWLARNAVAMPSEARLAEMVRQLWEAREDARVRVEHAGVALVRHKGEALIERGLAPAALASSSPTGQPWQVPWRRESELELGPDRGVIRFESAMGEGIRASLASGEWCFRARAGGETIRLGADRPTRTLKNLLHERELPMWQRDNLPLLFHGDRLVWVPGVGIAADYACGEGEEGLSPSWRVAGKAPLC
jgi:tRNA(Ile)-lysidine synthase